MHKSKDNKPNKDELVKEISIPNKEIGIIL